jgi:hypothetical protein
VLPFTPRATPSYFSASHFPAKSWSERRDLNPGPPVPQTGALTGLRYAPSMARTIALIVVRGKKAHSIGISSPLPVMQGADSSRQ